MGWNSRNKFACEIDERLIRETADAMVKQGLNDAGFQYVNIDDCWQGQHDADGNIQPDPKRFPSGMKALASQVGHSWRTTPDIYNCFDCEFSPGLSTGLGVLRILDKQAGLRKFAGPGHWNDMDMLEVGNGMSEDEDRAHLSIWAMMASPLILGNDLRSMSESTRRILTNPGVIAVNQDKLGVQALRVLADGPLELYAKPLDAGQWALMFLNRSNQPADVHHDWKKQALIDDLSNRSVDFKQTVYP